MKIRPIFGALVTLLTSSVPFALDAPRVVPYHCSSLERIVNIEAAEKHLDPAILKAIIQAESGWQVRAISRTGDRGLMQLSPATAHQLGVSDPFDPWQNVEGGSRHFKGLLNRFGGDLALSLAAYNAGVRPIELYRGIPPFSTTQKYVRRVQRLYVQYSSK